MTLHFSQILFTEGRTFICLVPFTSVRSLYVCAQPQACHCRALAATHGRLEQTPPGV